MIKGTASAGPVGQQFSIVLWWRNTQDTEGEIHRRELGQE